MLYRAQEHLSGTVPHYAAVHGEGGEAGLRVPAVAAPPPTISSSAPCDLAVALARSCASATASCQEASPCSAAGAGAEGAGLSPASEKMREDLASAWC